VRIRGLAAAALAVWTAAAPAVAQDLPAGVAPLTDDRPARFVLTGGNVVEATRIGEDAEFFWVRLPSGARARVRKSEVVSMRFDRGRRHEPPPSLDPLPEPEPRSSRRGRGLVVGGGVMFGVFYLGTLLFLPSSEGPSGLLAIPVLGPVLYGVARSLDADDLLALSVVSVLQGAGAVMLVVGVAKLTRPARRHAWRIDPEIGPRRAGLALSGVF
jgi:hypothetical protein